MMSKVLKKKLQLKGDCCCYKNNRNKLHLEKGQHSAVAMK